MRNMLIRPTKKQLKSFDEGVDMTIFNAGDFYTTPKLPGVGSKTCVALNFKKE